MSEIHRIVGWYFERIYGRWEGRDVIPFYCDPTRVGAFAVSPSALAVGKPGATFKLFVSLSMFQARRDVVIMAQQRTMPRAAASSLVSLSQLRRHARSAHCKHLESAASFDTGCSVRKEGNTVTCAEQPIAPCHVKTATSLLRRTGDMGKLSTSALLHFWNQNGGTDRMLRESIQSTRDPVRRADYLVERFSTVYRVGRKLATMFVSALSFPPLARDLTAWYPDVDGRDLVIVDTNVARAVAALRPDLRSYDDCAEWIRREAESIDLSKLDASLPAYSPRLVQQAIYWFASRSNRVSQVDTCATTNGCRHCVPAVCPFALADAR